MLTCKNKIKNRNLNIIKNIFSNSKVRNMIEIDTSIVNAFGFLIDTVQELEDKIKKLEEKN